MHGMHKRYVCKDTSYGIICITRIPCNTHPLYSPVTYYFQYHTLHTTLDLEKYNYIGKTPALSRMKPITHFSTYIFT